MNSPVSLVPLLDAHAIEKAVRRIAAEIVENHRDLSRVAIVGIPTRGVQLAERIAAAIADTEKTRPAFGVIDAAMHRDDFSRRSPAAPVGVSRLPLPIEGKVVVLVDDVLYTGRTIRAALDALSSYGRPDKVELAALVDRGLRELPIQPDYVGKTITTTPIERIRVRLSTLDTIEEDTVWLVRPRGEVAA